ncbi:sugar ABC transporter substrate-binding protein [Microbacterium sp. BR1]|uniref:sugar ABC transporter substrate-binding protein n=1 Tax=Microbacterium sp. BR1 TaxID=1070896 RepID=UPI0012FE1B65|nr:sugar ABC transporter substrate-binding protein [Microbacterium sp. BR1]
MERSRTRTRAVLAAAAIVVTSTLVTACASTGGAPSPSADGGALAGKDIYLVGAGDVNPWAKAHNATIIEGLEEQGADVTYLQDPYDVELEVRNLEQAVAAAPDLILLLAVDFQATIPALSRAQQAGIPVFNLSDPPGETEEYVTASIEADHVALGTFAAENIIEGLQAQGLEEAKIIAITGTQSLEQVGVRMEAFEEKIGEHPGYEIVAIEDGNWDQATTQRIAEQLFAQYQGQGGIQAAYGMADNQAAGIIQAAKQAGLEVGSDGLIVTGSNCYQVGIESILAGEQYGTATQSPYEEGEFVVEQVISYFGGEQLPKRQQAPETRVTVANAQEILDAGLCP